MSNVNCSICSEIYNHSDGVVVTKCGHLFHQSCLCPWLDRSATCPQCRHNCTQDSLLRIYFNFTFNEPPAALDNIALNELLDNANSKLRETEIDLSNANEVITILRQRRILMEEVEQTLHLKNAAISVYLEEISTLKNEIAHCQTNVSTSESKLKTIEVENTKLNNIIVLLKLDIRNAIQARIVSEERVTQLELARTSRDSEDVLKKEVITLESNLQKSESIKAVLSSSLDKMHADLCNEIKMRKKSEERLDKLENKLISATIGGEMAQASSHQKLNINYEPIVQKEKPQTSSNKNMENSLQPRDSNKQLLLFAKDRARLTGWKFVWEKEGKVFARKEDTSKVYHITNLNDLNKIE